MTNNNGAATLAIRPHLWGGGEEGTGAGKRGARAADGPRAAGAGLGEEPWAGCPLRAPLRRLFVPCTASATGTREFSVSSPGPRARPQRPPAAPEHLESSSEISGHRPGTPCSYQTASGSLEPRTEPAALPGTRPRAHTPHPRPAERGGEGSPPSLLPRSLSSSPQGERSSTGRREGTRSQAPRLPAGNTPPVRRRPGSPHPHRPQLGRRGRGGARGPAAPPEQSPRASPRPAPAGPASVRAPRTPPAPAAGLGGGLDAGRGSRVRPPPPAHTMTC